MMNQSQSVANGAQYPVDLSSMNSSEVGSLADREMSRYLPQLSRMSTQLKQTSAQIESSVVEVCKSFQGIAEQAKATVNRGQSFLSAGSGGDRSEGSFDNLIRRCGDTLVKVLNAIEESGQVSRRAIERISQMDAASNTISKALEELEQIAQGNRMMALNARIEASHAGEKGTGFAVVAVEVASQTEKSQEVTARVGMVVDQLRELAGSTLEDLEKMIAKDAVRVEQCRQEVDGSLAELRLAHGAMKSVLAGMSQDGEQLASEIGLAVRGMQFQDRVSQRLAHVVEDLDTLQTRLTSGGGPLDAAVDDGFSAGTMSEERELAGLGADESGAGDVELF